ncbi:MAG TPA: acyl-CoA dehydratase activase-related protein, partial [Elusimicrobiota bacterium]|nr:acyl-CoA dehydratase activase-related protein [Elusimicrobiota bacterium]
DPATLIVPKERRFRVLEPADRHAHRVRTLPPEPPVAGSASAPGILGLDLGSTGAKAVLTSLSDGCAVWDLYDTTRGNPVEAAKRLVAAALARGPLDVRAVAVTGSGREAVATVLRAAYPDAADRIVVANEIIAHATAAIRQDPHRGRSLSVVEIGGQDAKFIQISGGQIVESDMNRACSAGTGSFLEEQAKCYGIDDVREFVRRAREARRPPDLGQMCTVFVAEAAAEALNEGFTLSDVFGGFQYSVVHNYIHRVMSHRVFGETIFFQGKPASGPSLAWTLAAVTGREVLVPDNPGAMGAWGIGLLAREERRGALEGAATLDLARFGESRIVESRDFQCHEPRCATLCRIEKTTVEGPGGARTVYNGGACPKYEISTAERPKLPLEAPSAFDEREALLAPFVAGAPGENPVGVPWVGALAGLLPWTVAFLKGLGLPVRVLRSDATSLARGEGRCFSYDSCAPAKLAHGVVPPEVERIFLPKVIDRPADRSPGVTCAMEQALPDILRMSGRSRGEEARWASPALSFARGFDAPELRGPLEEAARRLGADPALVSSALSAAARAQEEYETALAGIGRRTLEYGREHGIPVVAVVGSLHVIHDSAINAGVPRLLRTEGVLPLPMDCFPLSEDEVPGLERLAWGDAKRALRVGLACRARGDAYPLLLTAFGCSPLSFGEQFNEALLAGHPHTTLESDGHGGTAGYVTRVQAFLHTVRRHDRRPSPPPTDALRWTAPLPEEPLVPGGPPLLVFSVADRLPGILAANYRAHGVDARPAAPSGPAALAAGRSDCTGKECLPYQMLWGTFRKTLEDLAPGTPARLLQFSGEGACRNCVFSAKDQMSLARNGWADRVGVRHFGPEPRLGRAFFFRLYAGVVAWELLHQLASYHGARAAAPARALYDRFGEELENIMARPGASGPRGWAAAGGVAVDVHALLLRASRAFAEMSGPAPLRRALLSGDVYVRLDAGANDDLVRRLNRLGVAVLVEPLSSLAEYILDEKSAELFRLPTGFPERPLTRAAMVGLRRWYHAAARRYNPWLPTVTPADMAEGTRGKLDRHPRGEAPVTLGSVYSHWNRGLCDGAVVASPWGCGPALVAENLLRHDKEIPLLFLYCDGSPIDDRKLNAFAFRLRRTPARSSGSKEERPGTLSRG